MAKPAMQLYLLRHGIAEENSQTGDDRNRALTSEGRKKLRQVLEAAANAGVDPSLILSSPFKRAIETAEIAQQVLKYKGDITETEALVPDSTVERVWREVRAHRAEDSVMLVGHNPLFAELAGYLLGSTDIQIDVKKGSLLRIDMDSLPAHPKGVLRWHLTAKLFALILLACVTLAMQLARAQTPPNQTPSQQNQPATPMEFESHGLEYEALTRDGITVMFAPLPPHIKDYNIIQVTVTNGSLVSWTVKPSDFSFVRQDGSVLQTTAADDVIESLLEKASRNDVIKLQLLYEDSIYALSNFRSTNGYEKRREAAMAQFVKPGFKAAAAASAITLIPIKLKPGDSTDGAVFFETRIKEKTLGPGRFIAHTCGETFEFIVYPEVKLR